MHDVLLFRSTTKNPMNGAWLIFPLSTSHYDMKMHISQIMMSLPHSSHFVQTFDKKIPLYSSENIKHDPTSNLSLGHKYPCERRTNNFWPLRKWSKIVRTAFVRVFVTKALRTVLSYVCAQLGRAGHLVTTIAFQFRTSKRYQNRINVWNWNAIVVTRWPAWLSCA